jgi:hypothetical protein
MPGYDGTGPRGRGPMTGKGRGFCLLKISGGPNEPMSGFAGRSGLPVRLWPDGIGMDSASLSLRAQRLEAELRDIRRRIAALKQK